MASIIGPDFAFRYARIWCAISRREEWLSASARTWEAIARTSQGSHSVGRRHSSGVSERNRSRKRSYSAAARAIASERASELVKGSTLPP
jgi:hypothetical protein